jgi:predicted ATPase/class 3 adenylate cyclase
VHALPTGTVTFLFTDVESSTRLLRELGTERYADALAEHRRVVRHVCARHDGAEVDVQGDSSFFAFSTVPGALAAAEELIDELTQGPIRVRVGVHTGTPLLTAEGYVGADVHRTARIAAVGHGGQVLVSESTAAHAERPLRPLGEYQLRDLVEPVRLFQLGEGQFPALASLAGTNLPVQSTPLVGREIELAEALTLLRETNVQLLTFTGTGGTGKTRLALQVGAEAASDYRDGVYWVSLQALRDPDLVESAIAQAVGATHDLALDLSSKRALLVLDNFEQVIDAADVVGELCVRVPSVKVLVTSREPLRLAGEREYAVPPLQEREAAALFMERARAVKPGFADDGAVVEICRRVDCLPLAVELAAARVKALATEDLLRRLDRRLPLLTGGPRNAPERQRTLRATIAWSYDLLSPDAQRLFATLAVFAGGFTLEAAEEICHTHVDAIAELVDKSLLHRDGQRYFMLETIAEFAFERLEEGGELEDVRRRHAEYYLELARSVEDLIRSPQAAALLDQIERDHDNLRAALQWLPGAPPDRALRIGMWGLAGRLQSFGDVALASGNVLEAARLFRESLEAGRLVEDDLQTAYALAGLAAAEAARGRRDVAAFLWGCVRKFEDTFGARLHDTERTRYAQALDGLELAWDTSTDFARGRSTMLDEAVAHMLASVS